MPEAGDTSGRYSEHLRAPGWVFGTLGLLLGVDSGVMTAVALRSLGSDPWLTGGAAVLFFVSFGFGMAVIMYVMVSSTLMSVTVVGGELLVTMGMLGKRRSWRLEDMSKVAVTQHHLLRHGGRGNVFAPNSRRSWSMFGVKSGVEFEYPDAAAATRVYFIPSKRPEELAAVLGCEEE